jgi:hypothetical protein
VNAARFDLAEMREQLGRERIGTPRESLDLAVQGFVRELRQSGE